MERKFNIRSNEEAAKSGWEIVVPFPGELIGKATFSGYMENSAIPIKIMKSTKRMNVSGGFIYNTTTEYHKGDTVSVTEALVFVPIPSKLSV